MSKVCPPTKGLWQRRSFIAEDAKGRAFRTTRDYRWWKFWIIASPLLDALLYGALFGLLLKTNKGIDNYVGFVVIGITMFSVMNKMLMAGNGLMAANRSLIQAFTFPVRPLFFASASVCLRQHPSGSVRSRYCISLSN